jgi:Protein of unknown function (DUF3572)
MTMHGQEAAEALALGALAWMLGQDEVRDGFLAATGAAPADLARQAGDPVFLGAVLDFLLADDARVMAFCDAQGLRNYALPMQARAALPGGAVPDWT